LTGENCTDSVAVGRPSAATRELQRTCCAFYFRRANSCWFTKRRWNVRWPRWRTLHPNTSASCVQICFPPSPPRTHDTIAAPTMASRAHRAQTDRLVACHRSESNAPCKCASARRDSAAAERMAKQLSRQPLRRVAEIHRATTPCALPARNPCSRNTRGDTTHGRPPRKTSLLPQGAQTSLNYDSCMGSAMPRATSAQALRVDCARPINWPLTNRRRRDP
jgi:hypothetical protein